MTDFGLDGNWNPKSKRTKVMLKNSAEVNDSFDDSFPDSSKKQRVENRECYPATNDPQSTELSETEKNNRRWRYVLKVFDPVNNLPLSANNKFSSQNNLKRRRTPLIHNSSRLNFTRRGIAYKSWKSAVNTSGKNKKQCSSKGKFQDCTKENLSESEIVPSTSNDDSDDGAGRPFRLLGCSSNPTTSVTCSNQDQCNEESEIVWSSSNDDSDDGVEQPFHHLERCSVNPTTSVTSPQGQCNEESEIVSSSNESKVGMDRGSVDEGKGSTTNSEYELNMFIAAIEKDLRRTNIIRNSLAKRKSDLTDQYRAAIQRGKSDKVFLDYEQRAGILKGLGAVITEVGLSYGVCSVNVKLENGTRCCFLLYKCTRSVKVGHSLVSFVDSAKNYLINSIEVFVQPNKVVEA